MKESMHICFLPRIFILVLLSYTTTVFAVHPLIKPSLRTPAYPAAFAEGLVTGICVTSCAMVGTRGNAVHPLYTWAASIGSASLCAWTWGRAYQAFCTDYDKTALHILSCIPSKNPSDCPVAQNNFRKAYIALRTKMALDQDCNRELATCDAAYIQMVRPGLPVTAACMPLYASPTALLHNKIYAQAYALLQDQCRGQGFAAGAALAPMILVSCPYLLLPFVRN